MTETVIRKPDRVLLAFAVMLAAAGLYFMLAGIGMAPPPGKTDASPLVIVCVGLVFLAGGVSVSVRGWLGLDDKQADLPPGTARPLSTLYSLSGITVAAGLAMIGSWIAFGPGERHFAVTGAITGPVGASFGRIVFGIGAIIAWLMVAMMARRLLPKRNP